MTTKTTVPSAARPAGRAGAPARPWLALAVLCVSLLIVTLDNTVLNVVLPTLVRDLHATTSQLQFELGYTALQAGVRVLPAAGAIALVAPLSTILVRAVGTKLTTAAGLAIIAGGLWQISGATVATTYPGTLPGMIMLGVGAGLVIPSGTASVMGSLPREHTGVGSATNGAVLQIGGALGVAVIGSLLSTRYQDNVTAVLAAYHVPPTILSTILGSLGGALAVAAHIGPVLGGALDRLARSAFISGMDLGLTVGAAVALAGCLLALAVLPSRPAKAGPELDEASASRSGPTTPLP